MLRRTRNSQGILIGTVRTNPGKDVSHPRHLDEPDRVGPLKRTYEALCSIDVDAPISIGGDDTLKTANKMKMFMDRCPMGASGRRSSTCPRRSTTTIWASTLHLDTLPLSTRWPTRSTNLLHDAEAGARIFLPDDGSQCGWLADGAASPARRARWPAWRTSMGLSAGRGNDRAGTGETRLRPIMNVEAMVKRIVKTWAGPRGEGGQAVRRDRDGRGTRRSYLPYQHLEGVRCDDHGHITIVQVNLGKMFSEASRGAVAQADRRRRRKVNGVQLGYESAVPGRTRSM